MIRIAVLLKGSIFKQWLQQGLELSFDEYREERMRVIAVVTEAEDRFGSNFSHNFERNRKIFWKEVKRVQRGEQGEEVTVTCWWKEM